MTARPRGFLQRHNSGRGNCGLSTAAWDLVHRESDTRLEHTHTFRQTWLSYALIKRFLPYQNGGRGWLPLEATC